MTILRSGDIVAIVAKVLTIADDGERAEITFHTDEAYSDNEYVSYVSLAVGGLHLMEHGDPDYGVKIIEGVDGEWKIHNRLSSNVAVVQRVGSNPDDEDNFQVVAVERLKTQDKDLYRLVTGAELQASKTQHVPEADSIAVKPVEVLAPSTPLRPPPLQMPSTPAMTSAPAPTQAPAQAQAQAQAPAPAPAPEVKDQDSATHSDQPQTFVKPKIEEINAPASYAPLTPTMMRPDKLRTTNNMDDSPQAVDASIAKTHSDDTRISRVDDLAHDSSLGNMVRKAAHLHSERSEDDSRPPFSDDAGEPAPRPALDLESIADSSEEVTTSKTW